MRWGLACVLLIACGSVNKAKPDAKTDAAADAPPDAVPVVALSAPMGPTDFVDSPGGLAPISVHVHTAEPNKVAHVSFTGTLGTYSPTIIMVTTDGSGDGSASSMFAAGSAAGMETTTMMGAVDSIESPPVTTTFSVESVTRYGFPTPFTTDGGCGANYLLGIQISVPTGGSLVKLGFVSLQEGPNVKLGLYTSTGSAPGTLVAQAGPVAVHQGVNEVLITPVALAAGTYWFEALYDNLGHCGLDNFSGSNPIAYISLPFASALPTTFPAPSVYNGGHFNYFVVLK